MNTRDYQTEIKAMQKTIDGLVAKRTSAAVGRAFLKVPELLMRRPLNARHSLNASITRWDREFEQVHAEHAALTSEAAGVEKEEGSLVRCKKCGTLCRTRFGGHLDNAGINLLGWSDPLAIQDWMCTDCLTPALKRVEEIAIWHASFAGITRGTYLPGFRIVEDKGWICSTQEFDSEGAAKENLALQAARNGANACVFYNLNETRDREVAGHGPKGNPYYQTVVTYSAKARAVVVEPESVWGCRQNIKG